MFRHSFNLNILFIYKRTLSVKNEKNMHEIFKIKLYLFLQQNTPLGMSILGGCSYLKRHFSVCLSSCFPAMFPLVFCSTLSVPFLSLLFLSRNYLLNLAPLSQCIFHPSLFVTEVSVSL
jgi:hypothetical protein